MQPKINSVIELLLSYKRSAIIMLFISFTYILARVPLPFLYATLIDKALPNNEFKSMIITVALLVCCMVMAGISNYSVQILASQLRLRVMVNIKQKLYSSLQRVPYKNYMGFMSGDITSRVTSDLDELKYLLPDGIVLIIRDILLSFGLISLIFIINWKLSVISIVLIPIFIFVFKILSKKLFQLSKDSFEQRGIVKSIVQENLEGLRDIQVHNAYDFYSQETNKHIEASENANINVAFQQAKIELAIVGFPVIGSIVLWGIGGYGVISSWITIGQIVAFSYAYNYLFEPLSRIIVAFGHIQVEKQALQRIEAFNADPMNTEEDKSVSAIPLRFDQSLIFTDISFAYPDKKEILRHCNIEIEPGQVTAIVGPSGCGKTTLFSLMLRLLEPTSGFISLGKESIRAIPIEQWRRNIGLVPQDIFIFHGTLSANISMGRSIEQTELDQICELVGISEMITDWEEGLNTILTEKGRNLSGGQKQKIAIARALVGDPHIVLLDEPTNNLDEAARIRVHTALNLAHQGKTMIIATHDKNLLEGIDNVYELNESLYTKGGWSE